MPRRTLWTHVISLIVVLSGASHSLSAQIQPLAVGNGVTVYTIPSVDPNRLSNTGPYPITFWVVNSGTVGRDAYFTCSVSGPLTCTGVTPSSANVPAGDSVSVSLTYSTTSGTGSGGVTLTADMDGVTPPTSSGARSVTVAGVGKGTVTLLNRNRDNLDRGLCLTVGAGEAADLSCGDLLVVAGMPAYRTLGRDRSLSLHYNSATATGLNLIVARIVEPASIAMPSSIKVILTVNGTFKDSTAYAPPSTYNCGYVGCADTFQVVVGRNLNWAALPTGYYPVMVELKNIYPTAVKIDTAYGSTLVVNRSASEYGRGWGLLGVEQVLIPSDTTQRIWLAGDGSARVYHRGAGVTSGQLTQSGLTSFSAGNSVDGNLANTAWTTNSGTAATAYVRADFGATVPRAVTSARLYAATGSNATYDVQYSSNGTAWTTVVAGFRPQAGWSSVVWSSIGADRYWRLKVAANNGASSTIRELSFGAANNFYGAPGDAPDSLIRFSNGGNTWYRRWLKHGAKVEFDQAGRHSTTTNRVAAVTTFTWTTVAGQPRLATITVPPNDGTTRNYTFTWNPTTALLDSLRDPGGRGLRATITSGNLVKLRAPGALDSTRYAYDARNVLVKRIATRQRLSTKGDSAVTSYGFANSARVTQVAIQTDSAATSFATTTVTPWDEQGVTALVVSDTALGGLPTTIDGPITGTGDRTDIKVNRFGQPIRISTGLGTITTVSYDSINSLPARPTKVQYPHPATAAAGGRIIRLIWNQRGNLVEQRDSSQFLDSQPTKVARYTYGDATTPDSPTRVEDALGRHADYAYTTATPIGMTDSVIDSRGHRTRFNYVTSGPLTGLVSSVIEREVPTWIQASGTESTMDQVRRFTFDVNGNLRTDSLPTGVRYSYVADNLGRVTDVYDPLGTRMQRFYDAGNRIDSVVQYTAAQANPYGILPLQGCDSNQFVCADSTKPYPPALPATLTSTFTNGVIGIDSVADPRGVKRRYRRGARREVLKETDDYSLSQRVAIEPSGLVDTVFLRSGTWIRYRYDGFGRRTAMIFPPRGYWYKTYPDSAYGTVPGDSISYTYDLLGRVLVARSATSTVTRTYFADGAPRTEVSSGTSYDSLAWGYDPAGARIRFLHRKDAATVDSVRYFYNNTGANPTGDLDSMVVRWGNVATPYNSARKFTFAWDGLGRRRRITYPAATGGMTLDFRYDAGGTLRKLLPTHAMDPGPGLPDVFDLVFTNDAVDPIGRILKQTLACDGGTYNGDPCGSTDTRTIYNGYNRSNWLVRQQTNSTIDSSRYDASGNLVWRRKNDLYAPDSFVVDAGGHNRVVQTVDGSGPSHNLTIQYTQDGGRYREFTSPFDGSERYYFYDGLGRTSGLRTHEPGWGWHTNLTSCRYDALGRQTQPCADGGSLQAYDGDNLIRAGFTWHFFHGPALDDPLIGLIHPATGSVEEFFYVTDGTGRHFAAGDSSGYVNAQVAQQSLYDGWSATGGVSESNTYDADRLEHKDAPGLSFFRNRVYDQATARWTQEDPIGIAGGLNLYQFSGNDPVAYTDPFGLKPCDPPGSCILAMTLAGAGIGATAGAVAAAPTGELASPLTVPVGAALFGAAGFASGVALEYGDKIRAAGRRLINIIVTVGSVLAGGAGRVDDSTHAPDGVSSPPIEAPATPPAGTKDTSGTTRSKERPSGE